MKRSKLALVILLFFIGQLATGRADVRVSASLDRTESLPGLPVGFEFEIVNPGAKTLEIQNSPQLEVNDGDLVFSPAWGLTRGEAGRFPGESDVIEVAPFEVKKLRMPVSVSLDSPDWFFDSRIMKPGKYTLRLFVPTRERGSEEWTSTRSNDMTLVVQNPQGRDADVWNVMQEIAGSSGWSSRHWIAYGFGLARRIWNEYRDSSYTPHVVLIVPSESDAEKLSWVMSVMKSVHDPLLSTRLKFGAAELSLALSRRAIYVDKNVEQASSHVEAARRLLNEVVRDDRVDPDIRNTATQKISDLPSREGLMELRRLHP